MFVVMAKTASEAEILGVKSQILAEGLTPYDHVGAERVVIAVVGEIGGRKPVLVAGWHGSVCLTHPGISRGCACFCR